VDRPEVCRLTIEPDCKEVGPEVVNPVDIPWQGERRLDSARASRAKTSTLNLKYTRRVRVFRASLTPDKRLLTVGCRNCVIVAPR
jgi:hypothetical protein